MVTANTGMLSTLYFRLWEVCFVRNCIAEI